LKQAQLAEIETDLAGSSEEAETKKEEESRVAA